MIRISIIGPGRVGGALAVSLPRDKYSVEHLVYRGNPDPLQGLVLDQQDPVDIVSLDSLGDLASDIIFITTQDANIATAAEQIADKIRNSPIVFHTSGALSSSTLKNLQLKGCKVGSIHPLVSISNPESGPKRFPGAFFCIEGDAEAVASAEQIVADLGGRSFTLDTKFKTLYHAAAVTACGHVVALFDAAVEMMSKTGLSPEKSKEVLVPLVTSTIQNLSEQTTAAALTGTFAAGGY